MSEFKLLRPEEVIERWDALSALLEPATKLCQGEVELADIRSLVLSGRMFVFASDSFAVTCEFTTYPRRTNMVVGFGAGKVRDHVFVANTLIEFAKKAGADAIQTYCQNPSMVNYYKRFFDGVEPVYTVLEKQL
jgi:hypothetical protein